jgi:hypothetical protein
MRPPLPFALLTVLIALASTPAAPSEAGSCRHKGSHDCFKLPATLDFSSVPDISNRIVADEPDMRTPPKPAVDTPPAAEPYTGPMIGVNKQVGAPTVGYYWSIH